MHKKMNSSEYLRDKGLKATPVRLKVLELMQESRQAYTHTDLEGTFGKVDRITLYRVLKDFEEAGIVHKIMDMGGVTRFAVCKDDSCPHTAHTEEHAHFSCAKCHKMYCLEKVHAPTINLPAGFKPVGIHTLVHGICKYCA
jgi:Fur family ferric uptake transcriptional regulator